MPESSPTAPPAPSSAPTWSGQRVTVMGLGRFGGGLGVTEWLAARGATVTVTDLADHDALRSTVARLQPLVDDGVVHLHLGGHELVDFACADVVIANPAVPTPWRNAYLRAAAAAERVITTEIRLLVEHLDRRRVIGVTGSAGKSTTTAMIHHLLVRSGHTAWLGGNIGGSLLPELDRVGPDDWLVLELSSAMLYWLGPGVGRHDAPGFSPHIAVLTNLEPNHLDWHGSFEHYARCKERIFETQSPGDHAIRGDAVAIDGHVPLALPGAHNQRNAWTALRAVSCAIDVEPDTLIPHLASFQGLPHRICLVAERDGQRFYNDSKATTPGATVLAVRAFPDARRVHLIAGGYDKGIDLAPIAALGAELGGLYTIGATGPALAEAASSADECETLDRAVRRAVERMGDRDVLLLSPGCASWDQFEHYEARGDAFAALVSAL